MGNRKITAGYLQDPASACIAADVLAHLSEITGEKIADFRDEGLGGGAGNGRALDGLFSLLKKGSIDLVVSPMRALAGRMPAGTMLAAVMRRGNPFNCLVSSEELILEEQPGNVPIAVPDGSIMGQLLYYRPDLLVVELDEDPGELSRRMERGEIGGFVSPASDIEAMSCQDRVVEVLTSSICMPSAGQGAVGLVARADDRRVAAIAGQLDHLPSRSEVELEKEFIENLPGGGRGAAAVLGMIEEEAFSISAVLAAPDGSEKISATMSGTRGSEKEVAGKLAESMLESGGRSLLGACS